MMVLLGSAIITAADLAPRPRRRTPVTVLLLLTALVSLVGVVLRVGGFEPGIELLGLPISGTFEGMPVGMVSPITASAFLVLSIAMLGAIADVASLRVLARGVAAFLAASGLVLVVATLLGMPLLSAPVSIPASLPASATIVLTSVALWRLGRLSRASEAKGLQPYLWVFVGVGAVLIALGFFYYRQVRQDLRDQTEEKLRSAASLIASSVAQWRRERLGDAAVLNDSLEDSERLRRAVVAPASDRPYLDDVFQTYKTYRQYDRLLIFDAAGGLALALPTQDSLSAAEMAAGVAEALKTGRPVLQDFYQEVAGGRFYLALIVPVMNEGRPGPSGAVALRIDPEVTLMPFIEQWPGTSASTDAILIRRLGDGVQYLNHHRFQEDAAGLRISLSRTDVAAVQAVLGKVGVYDAIDNRGWPTIAAAEAVPDSPWRIVASMTLAEFRLHLWQQLRVAAAFIVLLLFSTGAGLVLLWRERDLTFYRDRALLVTALERIERQLRTLLSNSPTVIYSLTMVDGEPVSTEVSDNIQRILGYSPYEALQPGFWLSHVHADDRDSALAQMARMQVEDEYAHEYRFHRADGSVIWVHDQQRVVQREAGRVVAVAGAWHEVTDRRQVEGRLRESEERLRIALASSTRIAQFYAALSRCNEAIVRAKSEADLFPQICEAAVAYGGMAMAMVGLTDPATGRVIPVASYGAGTDYLDGIELSADAASPYGQGPVGRCIRENRPVWSGNFLSDPKTTAWHERARRYGWSSAISLPLTRGGRPIGALTIYASTADAFDDRSRRLLIEMATDVSFAIDTFAHDSQRVAAEAAVQASLHEKEALLKELHHRVKNNLQVITSLLRLEAGRSTQLHVRNVLGEMQTRVLSMALLHETLYRSGSLARVDLGSYLPRLATQIFRAQAPSSSVSLQVDVDPVELELDQAVPCGLIVNELVSNTLKHAFPDGAAGEVRISLHAVDGGPAVRLTIADNGAGLPADFEEARQRSLGLQLVGDLTRELRGTLDIQSPPGATFSLTFVPRTSIDPPSPSRTS